MYAQSHAVHWTRAVPISLFPSIPIPLVADYWSSRYRLCGRLQGRWWADIFSENFL